MAVAALAASDGRTVEVLNTVHGLTSKDFDRMCVRFGVGERLLWILNPIALLKAKLANAAELDQSQRQDRRHVSILIPIVREFLLEALNHARTGTASERDVVALLEAVLSLAISPHARAWPDGLGAKIDEVLPLAQMQKTPLSKVRNFAKKRLPRVLQELRK